MVKHFVGVPAKLLEKCTLFISMLTFSVFNEVASGSSNNKNDGNKRNEAKKSDQLVKQQNIGKNDSNGR